MSMRFYPSFGRSAESLLSIFFHTAIKVAPKVIPAIMKHNGEEDEDDDYVDPTPDEILDWMYPDEDSRPEEDQYGD